jgi:hypothetical protein
MNKVIVYHPDDWTNINAPFLQVIWNKFFQTEPYDKNKIYDTDKHVFWTGILNETNWYLEYHNRGHKVVIDHLWESNLDDKTTIVDNILTLRCRNWIWYNESLWYKSLGYKDYIPNKTYKNSFLMLMNIQKDHRDKIFSAVNLSEALYSYVEKNIYIDGDTDRIDAWQRYFNPDWYNATSFSVVVETTTTTPTFISEKTFKPLAYYHPFLLWGSPYTLQYVKEIGFETFGHIIDESYDVVLDDDMRFAHICEQVNNLVKDHKTIFNDSRTQEILRHNHNLFFDDSIDKKFEDEIVGEILKFITQ